MNMQAPKFAGTGSKSGNASDNTKESTLGAFVLVNASGETVRVFRWESEKICIIHRNDTRRIESVSSTNELEQQGIPFTVLVNTTQAKVRKSGIALGLNGSLKWVDRVEKLDAEASLDVEPSLEMKKMAAWSFGLQASLVGLFAVAGLMSGREAKTRDVAVTILPQAAVEKLLATAQIATSQVSKSAIPQQVVQKPPVQQRSVQPVIPPPPQEPVAQVTERTVVAPRETKLSKTRTNIIPSKVRSAKQTARGGGGHKSSGRRGFGTNEPRMNQIGALSALTPGPRVKGGNGGRGGLRLNAVGTDAGSGAGGKGHGGFGNNGSGGRGLGGLGRGAGQGFSNAMYGRGLIAAPFGDGGGAPGSGGYGTRGRAGGGAQGAGYGDATVVGSWKGTGPTGNGRAGSGWGRGGDGSGAGEDSGNAMVTGGLDRDQIADVIGRNIGQITYCYEQGLQRTPGLSGRVAVRFEIGPRGQVGFAKIARSSVRSAQVESCIVGKLKNWAFPKPQGGVTVAVTYPFTLRRAGS